MTKSTAIVIRTGAWIGMIGVFFIASPFSIPGMLIAIFRPHDYPRYIGSALALTGAVTMRLVIGTWIVRVGGASSGQWYIEIYLGCVSWALGSILVALSYWLASLAFRPVQRCASSPCL